MIRCIIQQLDMSTSLVTLLSVETSKSSSQEGLVEHLNLGLWKSKKSLEGECKLEIRSMKKEESTLRFIILVIYYIFHLNEVSDIHTKVRYDLGYSMEVSKVST